MSGKQIVMNLLERLPPETKLGDIAAKLKFLAALGEGEEEADCGELIPHQRVKREFAAWISK